ncbi:hypothetical protein RB599_010066 [Gaeumannomyces hyphopodioides]
MRLFSAPLLCSLVLLDAGVAETNPSYSQWSSIIPSSPLYTGVTACAKRCLAEVDTRLSCWSYGCVCSENTTGLNFVEGMDYVSDCAREKCPSSEAAAAEASVRGAFQGLCGVPFYDTTSSAVVTTLLTSGRSTVITTTTVVAASTTSGMARATLIFDPENPVKIDEPESAYNKLDPCVRWVLNVCKGKGDDQTNCHPRPELQGASQGTGPLVWKGLGYLLECSNSECVCSASGERFLASGQKLYEKANYYCSIGIPYQGRPQKENEAFTDMMTMISAYCSVKGNTLSEWLVAMFGNSKETGLTPELKVTIAATVISSIGVAFSIYSALRKPQVQSDQGGQAQKQVTN